VKCFCKYINDLGFSAKHRRKHIAEKLQTGSQGSPRNVFANISMTWAFLQSFTEKYIAEKMQKKDIKV